MLILEAQKRNIKDNPGKIRREGMVPAVFYGHKEKSTPISISQKEFLKIWKTAGESSIIAIKEKGGEEFPVLIQDVDRHPVTDVPIHVDFFVVEKDKKLKLKIPIEFTGVSAVVKDLGGILVKVMHELEIESLPKDLPHSFVVDISSLVDFKSQILAKDITLPAGVSLVSGEAEVVAAITEPRVEEEKPVEPVDLSTIEVEKKGKEAKEGEEAEETEGVAKEPKETKKSKKS